MFLVSFSTYPEHSMHGNSYTPFSIMLLTDPTYAVANRLAKMNFSSNLTCGQNIFNEEPACLETVWNFYYLGLLQGNGFYHWGDAALYFGIRSKKSYRPMAFVSLEPIIKRALYILFCTGDSVFLIGCPCSVWCRGITHNRIAWIRQLYSTLVSALGIPIMTRFQI